MNCRPRWRWRNSISRTAAPLRLVTSSRQRSKAFRRRPEMPEIAEAQALLEGLAPDSIT